MISEKISVIMGVYNCSTTLDDAIDSIINQTYSNWEFIICDDCSTDNTYNLLLEYKKNYPENFIILKNKHNSKLAYTLNHCLKYSSGNLIARMDGDDISHPKRFEKQVNFLKTNPNVSLVGTSMQRFNDLGKNDVVHSIENPDKYTLKDKIPFNHATILTYKKIYDELGGYTVSPRTIRSQDYDLWFRFYEQGFIGKNLTEPLYFVRENSAAIRRRTFKVRFNAYKTTILGYKMLNYPVVWYIPATLKFIGKSIVPFFIIDIYRKYQATKI